MSEKVRHALEKIREAREEVNKFIQTEPLDKTTYFDGKDIVQMSLAFDNEQLALIDYELALAEEFPSHYNQESIEQYRLEKVNLEKRIELLKKGVFPPIED